MARTQMHGAIFFLVNLGDYLGIHLFVVVNCLFCLSFLMQSFANTWKCSSNLNLISEAQDYLH